MLAYIFVLLVAISVIAFGLVHTVMALIFVASVLVPYYALKDMTDPHPADRRRQLRKDDAR